MAYDPTTGGYFVDPTPEPPLVKPYVPPKVTTPTNPVINTTPTSSPPTSKPSGYSSYTTGGGGTSGSTEDDARRAAQFAANAAEAAAKAQAAINATAAANAKATAAAQAQAQAQAAAIAQSKANAIAKSLAQTKAATDAAAKANASAAAANAKATADYNAKVAAAKAGSIANAKAIADYNAAIAASNAANAAAAKANQATAIAAKATTDLNAYNAKVKAANAASAADPANIARVTALLMADPAYVAAKNALSNTANANAAAAAASKASAANAAAAKAQAAANVAKAKVAAAANTAGLAKAAVEAAQTATIAPAYYSSDPYTQINAYNAKVNASNAAIIKQKAAQQAIWDAGVLKARAMDQAEIAQQQAFTLSTPIVSSTTSNMAQQQAYALKQASAMNPSLTAAANAAQKVANNLSNSASMAGQQATALQGAASLDPAFSAASLAASKVATYMGQSPSAQQPVQMGFSPPSFTQIKNTASDIYGYASGAVSRASSAVSNFISPQGASKSYQVQVLGRPITNINVAPGLVDSFNKAKETVFGSSSFKPMDVNIFGTTVAKDVSVPSGLYGLLTGFTTAKTNAVNAISNIFNPTPASTTTSPPPTGNITKPIRLFGQKPVNSFVTPVVGRPDSYNNTLTLTETIPGFTVPEHTELDPSGNGTVWTYPKWVVPDQKLVTTATNVSDKFVSMLWPRTYPGALSPKTQTPMNTPTITGWVNQYNAEHKEPQSIQISADIMEGMQTAVTQKKADKWWGTLSPVEKAASLMTAGTIDINVAGAYFGKKIFGTEESKAGYVADTYTAMNIEGAKTQTPTERLKEAIWKVGTGTSGQTLAFMVTAGAAMPLAAGAAARAGLSTAKIALTEKAINYGFTGMLAADIGSKAVKVNKFETLTGFAPADIVYNIAKGNIGMGDRPGGALAEAGLIAVTLPFGQVGQRAVELAPSGREIGSILLRNPTTSPLARKFIPEKSITQLDPMKLMTPDTKALVYEPSSPAAKKVIESQTKLMEALWDAPLEQRVPIDFTSPKYGGKIGKGVEALAKGNAPQDVAIIPSGRGTPNIKDTSASGLKPREVANTDVLFPTIEPTIMIKGKPVTTAEVPVVKSSPIRKATDWFGLTTPNKVVIGGSTSIGVGVPGFRRGADFDLYATNYKPTIDSAVKMSGEVYPGSSFSLSNKGNMVTLKQEGGVHSIADIHKMSDFTDLVGRPFVDTMPTSKGDVPVVLTPGKGTKPITIDNVDYINPKDQMYRKAKGTLLYLKSLTMTDAPHQLAGRKKDVMDAYNIFESLARSKAKTVSSQEAANIFAEINTLKGGLQEMGLFNPNQVVVNQPAPTSLTNKMPAPTQSEGLFGSLTKGFGKFLGNEQGTVSMVGGSNSPKTPSAKTIGSQFTESAYSNYGSGYRNTPSPIVGIGSLTQPGYGSTTTTKGSGTYTPSTQEPSYGNLYSSPIEPIAKPQPTRTRGRDTQPASDPYGSIYSPPTKTPPTVKAPPKYSDPYAPIKVPKAVPPKYSPSPKVTKPVYTPPSKVTQAPYTKPPKYTKPPTPTIPYTPITKTPKSTSPYIPITKTPKSNYNPPSKVDTPIYNPPKYTKPTPTSKITQDYPIDLPTKTPSYYPPNKPPKTPTYSPPDNSYYPNIPTTKTPPYYPPTNTPKTPPYSPPGKTLRTPLPFPPEEPTKRPPPGIIPNPYKRPPPGFTERKVPLPPPWEVIWNPPPPPERKPKGFGLPTGEGAPARNPTYTPHQRTGKPNPWFPASYENVTMEEFGLRGKGRATHIESKTETRALKQNLIKFGASIPTLAQEKKVKASGKSVYKGWKYGDKLY